MNYIVLFFRMYKYINHMQTDTNGVVEYQTDVFLAPWFNCAGFLVHTLPNIILFTVVAISIQYINHMQTDTNCMVLKGGFQ